MKNTWINKYKDRAKDHIKFMLGAPVIKVELDETQLDHAVDYSESYMDLYGVKNEHLLADGAYYHAMIMLGHVRGKYGLSPATGDAIKPIDLVKEGMEWLDHWKDKVSNPIKVMRKVTP